MASNGLSLWSLNSPRSAARSPQKSKYAAERKPCRSRETSLTIAARKGHVKVVRQLLERCTDVYSSPASHDRHPALTIPSLHSSIPPVLLAILLGDGDDNDKFAITQEIIKHSAKSTFNIPSSYRDWGSRNVGVVRIPGELNLLGSLLASLTPSQISEAILWGIRDRLLAPPQLSRLLEASPSKVEIRKDIMIAAAPAQRLAIPTIDKSKPIRVKKAGTQLRGLTRALIASLNTTFDLDAYLYISREWPENTIRSQNASIMQFRESDATPYRRRAARGRSRNSSGLNVRASAPKSSLIDPFVPRDE
ncbi:hypothetical protein BGX38DRAFT_1142716 [Terfezia claveryi]|nr:hypothetical protein BGX38DRAFT_1142716 [Terfezia claveryi]